MSRSAPDSISSEDNSISGTLGRTIDGTIYIPGGTGGTPGMDRLLAYTPDWTFSDVPFDHWAFHEIEACYRAGIVSGYEDGTYRPIWTVSRDQMAAYISRALALGDEQVPTGPAQASFPDVPADHWAYDYVEYALAQNVVAGYEDGLYHPARSVDRAQMAVFIAGAICGGEEGVPPPGLRPIFSDVTDSNEWSWCYKHVQYLGAEGIISGYPGGLYHPEHLCSRDQMAVYIAKAFDLPM